MAATAGWLRLCFLAVLLALSAFFADSEEVFHVQLYAPSTANSTTGDTCESNFTDISLETGCQLVGGVRAQFDCVDHGQLRLVTGYADVSCTVEASTGYVEETIERTCTQLSSSSEIYLLLKREYPGLVGSKSNTGYLAMLDSPCLTAFEEFEQDLGLELLTIFGLNNITNATDPVLYEVKETLFTYGIVFVAGMILMGLLLCICGYKFFWLTLFISGLAVCGYLGYFAWMQITLALDLDVAIVAKGILPSFLVCGIIGGLLAWKFIKLGIFVLGACFGGAVGYLIYMSIIQSFWTESWGLYVVVGGAGLLFGVIFVFKYKFFVVVCTALIGAFAMVSGVSFLIGYYPSLADIEEVENDVNAVTWQFWLFFGSFLALTVISIIIQQCIKKKDQQKKYQVQQASSPRRMSEMPPREENPFLKK